MRPFPYIPAIALVLLAFVSTGYSADLTVNFTGSGSNVVAGYWNIGMTGGMIDASGFSVPDDQNAFLQAKFNGAPDPGFTKIATISGSAATFNITNAEIESLGLFGEGKDITFYVSAGGGTDFGVSTAETIDQIRPAVTNITSTTSGGEGLMNVGDAIYVRFYFSENAYVTDNPQLELETGADDALANYYSNSGGTYLNFLYTVQSGHESSDLDYTSEYALISDNGQIRDAAGNEATYDLPAPGTPNSLGANTNFIIDGIVPTITNVTSPTANGSYKAGDLIYIEVTFSENVRIHSGTPQLELETGQDADVKVNYTAGDSSTTFTFTYAVQAGHTTGHVPSGELDYTTTSALTGTIRDYAGNNADKTLPPPGQAGSLGFNKNLIIDTDAPTVENVSSTKVNGSYTELEQIYITVTFSEVVFVTGTPILTLETGLIDAQASYSSGSGTAMLALLYIVDNGDNSSDLDYIDTNPLSLDIGESIRDAAGNNANLASIPPAGGAGSLSVNKDLIIDTAEPTVSNVSSTSPDGPKKIGDQVAITVTFSEVVYVTAGTPQLVLETGTSDEVVAYNSGTGTTVLTFNYTVQEGNTSSDLDYGGTSSLTGSIQDLAGNNAVLTLPNPAAPGSLGDNKNIVIDGIRPTVSAVTSSSPNGHYKAGEVIPIKITFDQNVVVTGVPRITLDVDGSYAVNYTFGGGSDSLIFNYTVQGGHTADDLEYASTSALGLNGGTIKDESGNDAVPTLPVKNTPSSLGGSKRLVIDTTPPTVTNVTSTQPSGYYVLDDLIPITVTFSEPVLVSGTPLLTLDVGGGYDVAYNTGTGSATLTFNYTVQAGHNSGDLDYTGTDALSPGTAIQDSAGNGATLTLATPGQSTSLGYNKNLIVDTEIPTVLSVSSTASDGAYKLGSEIPITVTFGEPVLVSGTPTLTLDIGDGVAVDYSSGSGTDVLIFNYVVDAGENTAASKVLAYKTTTSLALNGGDITDAAGNDANLTLANPGEPNSLSDSKSLVIDTTVPTVVSVSSTALDGYYLVGEIIPITITFSEAVNLAGGGTPTLELETGENDSQILYASGSGTAELLFNYTVASGHESSNLDYTGTDALQLNLGTIRDDAGNNATLDLPTPGASGSLGYNRDRKIDAVIPTVTAVTSNKTDGAYKAGVLIPISVAFSEAVAVTGPPANTPTLTLDLDGGYTVDYTSGSGSDTLVFEYTVQSGQNQVNLDYLSAAALSTNGGAIRDAAGNDAALTLPGVGSVNSLSGSKNIDVDTTPPTVSNVTSTTSNAAYKAGQSIDVRVTFSEVVIDAGSPYLILETGTTNRNATYVSGKGTNTLVFSYTVVAGDSNNDLDYVSTGSLVAGISLEDSAGNPVSATPLATPGAAGSLGANKAIIIDTEAPTVLNVTSSKTDGYYKAGETIPVSVEFSEVVTVTGTPTLTLETDATDRNATYSSGSGSTTLLFDYVVQSGDGSSDLDYVDANSLSAGTSIQDAAGNDATLTLANPGDPNSLGDNKALVIDTTPPTVLLVSSTAGDGYYVAGDTISITVSLTETVYKAGAGKPTLALETGGTDAVVDYVSGSGTNTLTFTYIVALGHESDNLDYTATDALKLNLATIKDAAGNSADLTLAAPGASGSLGYGKDRNIDAIIPTVTKVTSTLTDGIYKAGVNIPIAVIFSELVIVSTAVDTPTLTLDVAGGYAVNYSSGSGSDTLIFNYTVQTGHDTTDLEVASINALALNGGTIKDAASNDAALTLPTLIGPASLSGTKELVLDTTAPEVVAVSSLVADDAYKADDSITVVVVFSEPVTVTGGPPQLILETGTNDAQVSMSGGSDTDTLVFNYTVQSGDSTTDLDVAAPSLSLNGATMVDVAGNDATLTLPSPGTPGSLSANKDIIVDTEAPAVVSVTSNKADSLYKAGMTIPLAVAFTETLTVTGTPTLTLDIGGGYAVDYASGSGGDTLFFDYTVQVGDSSDDLAYQATNSLSLNGGTIIDQAGNGADLTLPTPGGANSLSGSKDLVIDTQPPQAALTYSDTLASQGDTVTVTATLNEAALDTPLITIRYTLITQPADVRMSPTADSLTWTYQAIIPSGNDGTVTVEITADDLAGNALTAANTTGATDLTVDNTVPGYVLTYSDSLVRQSDVVTITATFEESVKPTPAIEIDFAGTGADTSGAAMNMGATDSVWIYVVDIPDSNDGFATVTVTALDLVDIEAVPISGDVNTLKVDNTPPVITPTSPDSGDYVRTTAVAYTLGETIPSGQAIWTWESGAPDGASPHIKALVGAELNAGPYTGVLTNAPTLVQAAAYTVEFVVVDEVGNADTVAISTVTYDILAPNVTDAYVSVVTAGDKDSTQSTDTLTAHWGNFDEPTSDIASYYYAVGTTPGGTEIIGWDSTSTGSDTLASVRELQLVYKRWYYFSVRAKDGAGNVSDTVSSDGIRIVDRPRLTVNMVQNSVISEYVQIFVIDTLAMADSVRIVMDNLRVSVTEIDTFAYVGTHKLEGTGPHSVQVTGFSGIGDTTRTSSLSMALAKRGQTWVATSVDQRFAATGLPGSVTEDRYLLVVDSTLMGASAVSGGAYRLGDGRFAFDAPVKVSLQPTLDAPGAKPRAIYILSSDGRWEELPTVDDGEMVAAWTQEAGTFRLGPRTIIVPHATSLHQNYPNPFNPSTRIVFDLGSRDGPSQRAKVVVYNLLGQQVCTLYNNQASPGRYDLTWEGIDERGMAVASGIYFVRLSTSSGHQVTKKMLLIR